MISLYRAEDCPRCNSIEQVLEDMSVRHDVNILESGDDLPDGIEADDLPVLVDDDGTFAGIDAILDHLDDLESFRETWYKFQSDACYWEEDGVV